MYITLFQSNNQNLALFTAKMSRAAQSAVTYSFVKISVSQTWSPCEDNKGDMKVTNNPTGEPTETCWGHIQSDSCKVQSSEMEWGKQSFKVAKHCSLAVEWQGVNIEDRTSLWLQNMSDTFYIHLLFGEDDSVDLLAQVSRWVELEPPSKQVLVSIYTWICLRWLFTFYHY